MALKGKANLIFNNICHLVGPEGTYNILYAFFGCTGLIEEALLGYQNREMCLPSQQSRSLLRSLHVPPKCTVPPAHWDLSRNGSPQVNFVLVRDDNQSFPKSNVIPLFGEIYDCCLRAMDPVGSCPICDSNTGLNTPPKERNIL